MKIEELDNKKREIRTSQQNKAIHLFCGLLARELNDAGLDMRVVLKPTIQIPWNMETVKRDLWKPIQLAMLSKDSTTDLDTTEVSKVYDVLMRHLGERFGVELDFPSVESTEEYYQSIENKV